MGAEAGAAEKIRTPRGSFDVQENSALLQENRHKVCYILCVFHRKLEQTKGRDRRAYEAFRRIY